jgi:dolichol-phosphate hexosyltransferase
VSSCAVRKEGRPARYSAPGKFAGCDWASGLIRLVCPLVVWEGFLLNSQSVDGEGEFAVAGSPDPLARPERVSRSDGAVCRLPSPGTSDIKLSILMPAYNEESTVTRAVTEILSINYPCEIELIIVDDGSTDGTAVLLSMFNDDRIIVHRHSLNRGKGAALRSAASLATGTHLLPFDADLEYAAEDIPKMLEPVIKGRCEVVYGARLFGCNTVYQSYRYAVGNRLLTFLANVLFDASLTDLHTCLKLVPAATIKELSLQEIGFGLDTEVTALLLLRGIRPFEVPVSYFGRSHAQGKKITWRDAIKCIWILFRVRLQGSAGHGSIQHADHSQGRSVTASSEPELNGSRPVLQTQSKSDNAGIGSLWDPVSYLTGMASADDDRWVRRD